MVGYYCTSVNENRFRIELDNYFEIIFNDNKIKGIVEEMGYDVDYLGYNRIDENDVESYYFCSENKTDVEIVMSRLFDLGLNEDNVEVSKTPNDGGFTLHVIVKSFNHS